MSGGITPYAIYVESLGCPKNTVDTENVLGLLLDEYDYANEPKFADFLIINTCAFIHDAESESYEVIEDFCKIRDEYNKKLRRRAGGRSAADGGAGKRSKKSTEQRPEKRVVVMGCLAQKKADELIDKYGVDAVVGTGSFHKMPEVLERLKAGERGFTVMEPFDLLPMELPRVVTSPPHMAYIKISEGCDNNCTYCIIPRLRGPFRSRKIEDIVAEARALNVGELILIAQDTSRYGIDIYGEPKLKELLQELSRLPRLRWIRIHYLYPDLLTDELIEAIFALPKVAKYFDMPVQHVSDHVLKLMNRHTSKSDIEHIFEKIRAEEARLGEPACIRTTFIVGFPGETEADFKQLYDFVSTHRIDRLGVFTYSDMEEAASSRLPDKVDPEIALERYDEIMSLQQDQSSKWLEGMVGRVVSAVVESPAQSMGYAGKTVGADADASDLFGEGQNDGALDGEALCYYMCRTVFDAPEIDGELILLAPVGAPIQIGDFVRAEVTESEEYDLVGKYCGHCVLRR